MAIMKGSRYSVGLNIYKDNKNNIAYMDIPKTFIPVDENDYVYQIKAGENLDILATNFYGDPEMKWAILYANPNYITELDVKPGDYLNIPLKDKVVRLLYGRR